MRVLTSESHSLCKAAKHLATSADETRSTTACGDDAGTALFHDNTAESRSLCEYIHSYRSAFLVFLKFASNFLSSFGVKRSSTTESLPAFS